MKLEEIAKLTNGNLVKSFDYEVSKGKSFYEVELNAAPSCETMRVLYDNLMRVSYNLYVDPESKQNYCKYVINHKRLSDYEWV